MMLQLFMWAGAVGQTLFVGLWLSKQWHKTWVGRALMSKGMALCAVLWFWIVGFYFPDHPYRAEIRDALLFTMALAIWVQVAAFVVEFHDADKARRRARAERAHVE